MKYSKKNAAQMMMGKASSRLGNGGAMKGGKGGGKGGARKGGKKGGYR